MKIYTGEFWRKSGSRSKQKGKLSEKNMSKDKKVKLNGTVIVTYRCNARCNMCNRYKKPSTPDEEISLEQLRSYRNVFYKHYWWRTIYPYRLKRLYVNYRKSRSYRYFNNGFFTSDRIVDLCKEFLMLDSYFYRRIRRNK